MKFALNDKAKGFCDSQDKFCFGISKLDLGVFVDLEKFHP